MPNLVDVPHKVVLPGCGFYNRSSAVDARALMSRGRQANPVLTYETALRRFFFASRRWRKPMMMGGFFDGRGNRRRAVV